METTFKKHVGALEADEVGTTGNIMKFFTDDFVTFDLSLDATIEQLKTALQPQTAPLDSLRDACH